MDVFEDFEFLYIFEFFEFVDMDQLFLLGVNIYYFILEDIIQIFYL